MPFSSPGSKFRSSTCWKAVSSPGWVSPTVNTKRRQPRSVSRLFLMREMPSMSPLYTQPPKTTVSYSASSSTTASRQGISLTPQSWASHSAYFRVLPFRLL